MDSIVIPSRPIRDVIKGQKYHLLLSRELSPEMIEFYRTEAKNGSYLILDNSAHEQREGEDILILLNQAISLGVQELVVPDALFDKNQTLYRARTSLKFLRQWWIEENCYREIPQLMIVPQGETPKDYIECLWELVSFVLTMPSSWKWTIGVSKDYNDYFPGENSFLFPLIRDHIIPASREISAEIHLLGWPKPLPVLRDLSTEFSRYIRSTDSSRPVTFAMMGIDLTESLSIEYPGRPKDFFDRDVSDRDLLQRNIRVYRRLCRGTYDQ